MPICDKCGTEVDSQNDVLQMEFILNTDEFGRCNPMLALYGSHRHLIPVSDENGIVCEGSPSRAQYLPGQPLDPRPEYKWDDEIHKKVVSAYLQMTA